MPILALLAAASAAVSTPPAEPRSGTLQQQFDAASDLFSARKCTEALPLFEQLERDPRVKPGSLPAAAIAVRKGVCLIDLTRYDEGERAIAIGLPGLRKAGANFDLDISRAQTALGSAAYFRSDYPRAARYYRLALETQQGESRLSNLAKLAKATVFDGGTAALEPSEEALRILAAEPKPDKDVLATFHTLHARALLNQGKNDEAYAELKKALSLSGGLSTRTTLPEVALRSDLAMAAMLTGHKSQARLYLAYTGAGRIQESPFTRAASMAPPVCGSETGLRPDDVAVVEFGIGDDGYVTVAHTVYSRGGPQVAAAFEKAVSQWYWKPEDIAKVPMFYKLLTRVELRCSSALGDRPSLWAPLSTRYWAWAAQHLPEGLQQASDRQEAAARLNRIAEGQEDATSPLARIAALNGLAAGDTSLSDSDRLAMLDKALTLAATTPVPVKTANWMRAMRIRLTPAGNRRDTQALRESALELAQDPTMAQDALAADTLRMFATGGRERNRLAQADQVLEQVAHDDRLDTHHPLRQAAWLELANRAASEGDMQAAQANFQQTGLTAEQCALLSLPPAIRRTNVSSSDYPVTAAMMGFEGWVQIEYDIESGGETANVRPIVAYPPLIFVDAATDIGKDLQYEWSYRPGGSTACSANTQTISFKM
ncbi:energy transducer TonB [Novosphingobium mangrovi (ex Huang et al. 2023)]|uniref:Energy transducer TonB n=1 Tax=Novosphingobium mangrovi (ex Huang et al. 2023) TaxID=2976432 RepID=A0ABT2I594_9SPHN|nr:energy transducer TonB [Novosphingobium mangrovi (ex Huang et al. 2023)]MCT2399991.1 energy transducer TonB [Novosphingobium mangrovi (ex Huang et al. 2023)]